MLRRSAEVLISLSDELEQLGAALCADPDICARHIDMLQRIDRIAQTQRGLAAIIAAPEIGAAAEAASLDDLRIAIQRPDSATAPQ